MKRAREEDRGVALDELLRKFEALSLVVKAEIPHVLDGAVTVPPSFGTSPVKREKKT